MRSTKTIFYASALSVFLFGGLIFAPLCLNAQKVAVVLSGGGAKGVCHVGLLKALEEHDIPIDYIAGTSMGAIVGGLYASGYTPAQMEELFLSEEFMRWASGTVDPSYNYYYKKDNQNAAWTSVKLKYNEQRITPRLPTNIVSPYEMDFQFMQIFAESGAVAGYDFDKLLVPFRCVASDIAANRPFVLRRGSLENAIRASMTFPFYFKPIKIDGRLLFDGGMYNNFPVDVVIQDFKPDFIIGCRAAGEYADPDPNNVLSQIENMLMTKTPYEIPQGHAGVMVKPGLLQVDVTDFSRTRAFIDSGYVAALALIDSIKLSVRRVEDAAERQQKRDVFNTHKPETFIDSLHVEGVKPAQAEYVRKLIRHEPKKRLLAELKPDYFRLVADDRISSVFPRIAFNRVTGYYDLHLEVETADHLELFFGGVITSTPNTEGFLQANYYVLHENATTLSVNSYFGRFYTSGLLRARLDYPVETPYFVEMGLGVHRYNFFPSNFYFLDDVLSSNLSRDEKLITGTIGWPVTTNGVFRMTGLLGSWGADYYHTNAISRNDIQDRTTYKYLGTRFCLDFNSFNYKQYPTAGSRFMVNLRLFTGNEIHKPGTTSVMLKSTEQKHTFIDLGIRYDNYFKRVGKVRLGMLAELFLSNRPLFNNFTSTMIFMPQFNPVPDAATQFVESLRAQSYLAGGLKTLLPLTGRIDWRLEGYYFQPFRKFQQLKDQATVRSPWFSHHAFVFSTALVAHSFLGPISFNLNYIDRETYPWGFTIHLGYLLFNKGAFD